MKILVSVSVALLCCILPACAAPAMQAFQNYLLANGCPDVIGVSGSVLTQGQKPLDLRIDFSPSASDAEIQQANTLANSFAWVDSAVPNAALFKAAVLTDSTIPAATKMQLLCLVGVVNDGCSNLLVLQEAWRQLLQVENVPGGWLFGNCTDGTAIVTKLQNYAVRANMPLQ